jgi:hypothetical protein
MNSVHSRIDETSKYWYATWSASRLHLAANLADGIQDDEPLASGQLRPPGYVIESFEANNGLSACVC